MKNPDEIKITEEQLLNLSLLKLMIEDNIELINFLLQKGIIKRRLEIENFKEKLDLVKNVVEMALHKNDYNKLIQINEVSEEELLKDLEEIKKIRNKKISQKYRKMLKDNLGLFFALLKETSIEDIAVCYNLRLYPISEMEWIYKYI